ncbi:transcriptional repressor [Streptomyces chattanoogensis]
MWAGLAAFAPYRSCLPASPSWLPPLRFTQLPSSSGVPRVVRVSVCTASPPGYEVLTADDGKRSPSGHGDAGGVPSGRHHPATRNCAGSLERAEEAAGFVSAQPLHARLVFADSPVGLSTVYRTLSALAEAGRADVVRDTHGERLFR